MILNKETRADNSSKGVCQALVEASEYCIFGAHRRASDRNVLLGMSPEGI